MTVSVRATALSPVDTPPPPRQAKLLAVVAVPYLFLAGLLPGIMIGAMIGPPWSEPGTGTSDPIACLIVTLA
jgi:hypothetical protein